MTRRDPFIFSLLLVLMTGMAQSQELAPSKQQSQRAAQKAEKQIGTDERPLVITAKPTESDKKEVESREAERVEKANSDKNLVYWTRVLAALAGLQFVALIVHACIFRTQSRALRETIESQERSERAILFMGKLEPCIFPTAAHDKIYPGDKDAPCPRIGYCFANLGRTAAIIDRVEVKLILEERLPLHPDYADSQAMDGETVLASGGTTRIYAAILDRHLTEAEITEVRNKTKKFYLFGFARYDDIFGYVHSYSFCFQFHPENNNVSVTGGEQYNFRHTQKKEYEIS